MKKILMAMLCCVFAVSLAVTGCSNKGGEKGGKEAAGKAGEKAAAKAEPKISGVQELGDKMCKAGLAGDVGALLDLMPPQMFDAMKKQMAEYGMEGDPREMFKEEMKGEAMLESCSVLSAEEKACDSEIPAELKEMGIEKVEACGVVKIKSKSPDEEEKEEEIPTIKVEGKWYIGDM
jgi:hypothetical protein